MARLEADVTDGFRRMVLVFAIGDLPVEARDTADLAEVDRRVAVGDGLLDGDDCAAVAPTATAEFTGVVFLGAGLVAVVAVEGVLPGTGFSLRLFTF